MNPSKTFCFSPSLRLEAYRFKNIIQPFPTHFHGHYSVGLVLSGERQLVCGDSRFLISAGDIVLFNPGDSHSCLPHGNIALNFIGFNLPPELMKEMDITGSNLYFGKNVVKDSALSSSITCLHNAVMAGSAAQEEYFFPMASALMEYCLPGQKRTCLQEIQPACEYMQNHYFEKISLAQLCSLTGLSRSTLLRDFARSLGVTPYRYLQALRISEAKRLLAEGSPPIEAAMAAGFSDQSHFSSFFNMYTGLTPGAYYSAIKKPGGFK